MNNEYIYLISIIKSVLTNTPFTHFLDVSYSKLFTIAKVHNVENFLYYGLIKNPSFDNSKYEEFSTRVTMAFKESLFKVATQGAEIEDLMKTFESEHIKFMPLKGAVIKNLYPHIDLRSMADFDCYFDKTQAKLIKKIMINLGYTVEMFNKGNHDVYYKKPYMNVEMHRELMNECYKISKYYKNINKKLDIVMNEFDEKMKTTKKVPFSKTQLLIEKDTFDSMNKVINETKKVIELEPKIQELFSEVNHYTKSHQTLEKENQSMQREIKSLKTRNHNLTEENNNLKSYISTILEAIKRFFRKILLFGNDKSKSDTTREIIEYYDNKDFNSDDVYDISRSTDKEDELFDYANIPSYMKSNKNTYNEKDKDDFELEK